MNTEKVSAQRPHLLVVDDDRRLRELLYQYLTDHHFVVTSAHDAADARAKLKYFLFDLVILDIMMPGETGLELARSFPVQTPILFLTARTESEDRIKGLEAGADDYLIKPFEPRELLLRIEAILRRTASFEATLKIGNHLFEPEKKRLKHQEGYIQLSETENQILKMMTAKPGEIFHRDDLAGQYKVNPRTIDVWMTRLRRKIEPDPQHPRYLQTIRHKGYVLWLS